jgi:integrase/recombinase XerD
MNRTRMQLAEVKDDRQLIDLWLHSKSQHSKKAYRCDIAAFRAFVEKSLVQVTLNDVQAFADALVTQGYATTTQSRRLSAVRSLLEFGQKVGYLPFNVASVVDLPEIKNTLAERILSESEVMTMIVLTTNPRDRLLLRFLYYSGCRVSEVANLKWRDFNKQTVTLFGKGGKTRIVKLPIDLWNDLMKWKGESPKDAPVFRSRKTGSNLKSNQIRLIVLEAGKRAGLEGDITPHWLRHSHATHSLKRGAPINLVQETLGHSSLITTSKYLHVDPADSSSLYLPE